MRQKVISTTENNQIKGAFMQNLKMPNSSGPEEATTSSTITENDQAYFNIGKALPLKSLGSVPLNDKIDTRDKSPVRVIVNFG